MKRINLVDKNLYFYHKRVMNYFWIMVRSKTNLNQDDIILIQLVSFASILSRNNSSYIRGRCFWSVAFFILC